MLILIYVFVCMFLMLLSYAYPSDIYKDIAMILLWPFFIVRILLILMGLLVVVLDSAITRLYDEVAGVHEFLIVKLAAFINKF